MLSFNFSKNPELLMPHLVKVCREVYGLRINAEEVSPVKVMFVLKRRAVLFASNRKYYGIAVILSDDQVAVYEYSGNVGLFKKSDFAVLKIKN